MDCVIGVGIYVNGSREAAALYQEAFGFQLGYHVLNQDGNFFHSELVKDGNPACSVVEAQEPIGMGGNPIELGYFFHTREELEQAFSLLKVGGKVTMKPQELPWSPWAACVTDRFGVRWFLSLPNHLPSEDFQPGNEQRQS